MRRLAACVLLMIFLLLLAGCETMRGFGKDLQKAGSWMAREAGR